MRTWDQVIRDGLQMYTHRDEYAYFFGAKGEKLTYAIMTSLWNVYYDQYFKKYSEKQRCDIFAYSIGKTGYDCSGFITRLTGCACDSASLIGKCTQVSKNISSGVAGSLLWLPGHIGLDIGYGAYLHMPSELHTITLGRFQDKAVNWTKTGKLTPYVNYEGSDAR